MRARAGLVALIFISSHSEAATFESVRLSDEGSVLTVRMSDGTVLTPQLETERFDNPQSQLEAPKISRDGRYVGWLADYPGLGASYAMPGELAVMDLRHRLHHFSSDWGLVFDWCFPNRPGEVVFAASYAHGLTEHDAQLWRIDDDKRLARYIIPSSGQEREQALANAPDWFQCIRDAVSRR